MKSKIEIIAELFLEQNPDKNTFTSRDLYDTVKANPEHEKIIQVSTADYPYWGHNYIAALLHTATKKAVNPKITRMGLNKVYHYKLINQ